VWKKLLPLAEVISATGLPPRVITALIADRRFPRPIPVNSRPMWWSDEVALWVTETKAAA